MKRSASHRLVPSALRRLPGVRAALSDVRGLTTIEYIVILALLAIGGVVIWRSFSASVTTSVDKSTARLIALEGTRGATGSGTGARTALPALPQRGTTSPAGSGVTPNSSPAATRTSVAAGTGVNGVAAPGGNPVATAAGSPTVRAPGSLGSAPTPLGGFASATPPANAAPEGAATSNPAGAPTGGATGPGGVIARAPPVSGAPTTAAGNAAAGISSPTGSAPAGAPGNVAPGDPSIPKSLAPDRLGIPPDPWWYPWGTPLPEGIPGPLFQSDGPDRYRLSAEGLRRLGPIFTKLGYDINQARFEFDELAADERAHADANLITINPLFWNTATLYDQTRTLAHELAHSAQFEKLGYLTTRFRVAYERV